MKLVHKYAAPKRFYELAGTLTPWFATLTTLLFVSGLYLGLYWAPPDYQQGNAYRIMFIHVPNAWMSMMAYMIMALFAAAGYIWNIRLADILAKLVNGWPVQKLDELLPWAWAKQQAIYTLAA